MSELESYCQALLINCLMKTQIFQAITLVFLTLLVCGQFRSLTKMLEREEKAAGSVSRIERWRLETLYTQGSAAYGSVHNLVTACNPLVSKMTKLLHSKSFETERTVAAASFKRMKAFAIIKNETRYMDMAHFW